VDRLRRPHPDPRLPAAGAPRRAHAGGRIVTAAAAQWRRQPHVVQQLIPALTFIGFLLVLAALGVFRWSKELLLIVVVVFLAFLAKYLYALCWHGLERVGVDNAEARWKQQPESRQRAVPPLVIAIAVILIVWAAGLPPDPALLVLLLITYTLYILPRQ